MNLNILGKKLYSNSSLRISAHLIFWLFLGLISWYMTTISFNTYNHFDQQVLLLLSFTGTVNLMLFYYPVAYFILPGFKKKRYLSGAGYIIILVLIYALINTLTESWILTPCVQCMKQLKDNHTGYAEFLTAAWPNRLFAKVAGFGIFISLIFSVSIPLAIKIALQAFRQQMEVMKLAKENVELEFNFLKSQVNPHFLFNTLNNIYGLILMHENTKAAGTVARLSEFMRYTLYSSGSEKMPLDREVQLIKDYIELEQIRLNYTRVEVNIQSEEGHDIPPLLLMPVIENAFKYGADQTGSCIQVCLMIKSNQLYFSVENSIDENRQLNASGGIGLQNFKKRLDLYYPGRYGYEVNFTDSSYNAKITIDL